MVAQLLQPLLANRPGSVGLGAEQHTPRLQVIDDLTKEGVMEAAASTSSINGTGSSLLLSYPGDGSDDNSTPSPLGGPGASAPVNASAAPPAASGRLSSTGPEPGGAPLDPTSAATSSGGSSSGSSGGGQGGLLGAAPGGAASPDAASPADDTDVEVMSAALGVSAPDVKDVYMLVSAANPSAPSVLPGEMVYLK
jgi:hypothetical protein